MNKMKTFTNHKSNRNILSWIFALLLFVIGILNIILIHPVPGLVYFVLSFLYSPPANKMFKERFGFGIPNAVKIVSGVLILMFTLGVSDLGDMIDKL
jgi:hypothetical protein